jgi:hypothetical protein
VKPLKLSLCGATALTHDAVSALLRLPVLTELDIGGCCRISAMDKMRLVAKVCVVLFCKNAVLCCAVLCCVTALSAVWCLTLSCPIFCSERHPVQVRAGREMLEAGRRPHIRLTRFPGLLL